MIIKDVLLKKCSYYYEFEELLEDSSIITSSFTLEFTRSVLDEEDAKNSKNETKNETNQNKNKNKKNETNQNKKNNIITQNVNDKNYVN
jgi:mannitol-specific phosphotransferase system IIBC component